MAQAILAGDLPIGGGAGNASVDAALAGADFVMLGALAKVPAYYVMALPEIKTVEDLRGKVVGITPLWFVHGFAMRWLLRKHGMEVGRERYSASDPTTSRWQPRYVIASWCRSAFESCEFAGQRCRKAPGRHGQGRCLFPHDALGAPFLRQRQYRFYAPLHHGLFGRGHALFTQPELAYRAIKKYNRTNDMEIVQSVHQYAMNYIEKIPYNTHEGTQAVLELAAARSPKAKTARPEEFYDDRFVKELETEALQKLGAKACAVTAMLADTIRPISRAAFHRKIHPSKKKKGESTNDAQR